MSFLDFLKSGTSTISGGGIGGASSGKEISPEILQALLGAARGAKQGNQLVDIGGGFMMRRPSGAIQGALGGAAEGLLSGRIQDLAEKRKIKREDEVFRQRAEHEKDIVGIKGDQSRKTQREGAGFTDKRQDKDIAAKEKAQVAALDASKKNSIRNINANKEAARVASEEAIKRIKMQIKATRANSVARFKLERELATEKNNLTRQLKNADIDIQELKAGSAREALRQATLQREREDARQRKLEIDKINLIAKHRREGEAAADKEKAAEKVFTADDVKAADAAVRSLDDAQAEAVKQALAVRKDIAAKEMGFGDVDITEIARRNPKLVTKIINDLAGPGGKKTTSRPEPTVDSYFVK